MSFLLASYQVLLFDAYGVLIDQQGALPGAGELIALLNRQGRQYFILTNDASRLPETTARLYQKMGLAIEPHRIITSGSLLAGYFRRHGLQGAPCLVLGPEDAASYVKQAGGVVLEATAADQATVFVICDESGYPFLPMVDTVLSCLWQRLAAGQAVSVIVPNPDLIYPQGPGRYGIASGSIALMLENVLQMYYPNSAFECIRLGKPYPEIYQEAQRRSATTNMVMIGDQLATDIQGAHDYGLDAVLVTTGVTPAYEEMVLAAVAPTYRLNSLAL